MNIGGLTNLSYDKCQYKQQSTERTAPAAYQFYQGKYVNNGKLKKDQNLRVYDLVDRESEIQNRTRPATLCSSGKYKPNCKKSKLCTSTFDKSLSIMHVPEVDPIVSSNLVKPTSKGYTMPKNTFCGCCK